MSTNNQLDPATRDVTSSSVGSSRGKPAIFYGWRIVAAAFVTQAIVWGFRVNVYGLFLKSINEERGWAPAATAGVLSVSLLCNSVIGPLAGRWVDRRGPKSVMLPGAIFAIAGMLLLSRMQEVWQYYVFYGVVYGIGETLAGAVPAGTVVSKWFVRKRGTALGIVAMASNVGGFIMLPLCSWVIATWDWRTATLVPIAFIAFLAIPMVSFVMRRTPEDMGLRPDGDHATETQPPHLSEATRKAAHSSQDMTLAQAIRTPAFWFLGLSWGLSLAAGLSYMTYIFSFVGEAGIPTSTAATALSLVLVLALPTRFLYGWLCDRLDNRWVMITFQAGIMLSYLSLTRLETPFMLYVSFVFCAFSGGGLQSVPQNLTAKLFGRRSIGTVLGTMTLFATLIVAAAIPLTGLVRQQIGSYGVVYWAFAIVLLVAIVAVHFARLAPGVELRDQRIPS